MKLPNRDHAVVDIVKLTDYCLSTTHPRGRHKARVFAGSLGLTVDQAELLRDALLEAARSEEATPSDADEFGLRYVVDFTMKGPAGEAGVRSTWIIRVGEDFPRLTSCYVL
jgi:hypothetical protein